MDKEEYAKLAEEIFNAISFARPDDLNSLASVKSEISKNIFDILEKYAKRNF